MNELLRVYAWLYNTLSADSALTAAATGGIYAGAAPEGTVAPYVVYNWQGGMDTAVFNGRRIMNVSLYQVKAVGPADGIAALQTITDRIDAVLQRASGTANGGTILFCSRERAIVLENAVNGVLWTNVGGIYRIWAK